MTFDDWLNSIPPEIANDALWQMTLYRQALFLGELAWFDVPSSSAVASRGGAIALVSTEFAGALHTWEGRVVRTAGEIDPVSRMVHVIVAVEEPFEAAGDPAGPGTETSISSRK